MTTFHCKIYFLVKLKSIKKINLCQFPSKNEQYDKIFFEIKIVKNASPIPIELKAFCSF